MQAFAHEPHDRARFAERTEEAFTTALLRIRWRAVLTGIVILLVFGSISVVLWVGGADVVAGRLSAGQLSAFVFYAVILAGALGAVSEVIGDLQRAAGAMERIGELLATPPTVVVAANPKPLPAPEPGRRQFRAGDLSLSVAADRAGARRLHPVDRAGRDGSRSSVRRARARPR